MPTGQTIVNNALTMLGMREQGGTPSVSDSQDSLDQLNSMWAAWGIDEGLIYAIVAQRFPVLANLGIYTIGPGALCNVPRPGRIYRAAFLSATGGAITGKVVGDGGTGYIANDTGVIPGAAGTQATYTVNTVDADGAVLTFTLSAAGTGYLAGNGYPTQVGGAQPGLGTGFTINILTVSAGGQGRNNLRIVPAEVYYDHNDLSATAQTPDELYPDCTPDVDGFARLFLFPVPSITAALEIQAGVPFLLWTLTGTYSIPQGIQDQLEGALAYRLLARFGAAVAQEVAAVVRDVGMKAEARIREMNKFNRQMPAGSEAAPGAQPAPQARP
jgi:hypothetical protein